MTPMRLGWAPSSDMMCLFAGKARRIPYRIIVALCQLLSYFTDASTSPDCMPRSMLAPKGNPQFACAALLEFALGVTGLLFSLFVKLTFSLKATYSESAYPKTAPISVLFIPLILIISAAE